MELRQLRYFEAVAREEHFGRAAQKLGLAQPALSRQIHNLEDELGILLFERLPRGVRLSRAGRAFLEDAAAILQQVDQATTRVRRQASGRAGLLAVGFSEAGAWHETIPRALRTFREDEPDVDLKLIPMNSMGQIAALKAGRIDAGIIYDVHHDAEDMKLLDLRRVGDSRIVLALPEDHALAGARRIVLADLAGEPLVWLRREVGPRFYDQLMSACLAGGLSPQIVQEAGTHAALLSLVQIGLGVGFVTSTMETHKPAHIVLRPVEDLDVSFNIDLVWRRADTSPVLVRFVEIVSRLAMCHDA